MSRAVAVAATGLCSGAGATLGESLRSAFAGADRLAKISLFESPKHGGKFVSVADGIGIGRGRSRCAEMMFAALGEALAKFDISKIAPERIFVYAGTSIGGIFETENMLAENKKNAAQNLAELAGYECSTLAELAAKKCGARGECAAFSTACSSSSLALAEACNAIAARQCDAAVVVGVDALSRITVNGFGSLLLLSQGKCRPFDKDRDGINLGEAAGVAILCADEFLGGAKPQAYIAGWARTCDAYHATAPSPDGAGAARAFENALDCAGVAPEKISYYNAHGTATKGNDSAEGAALRKIFGEKIPPVSSLKRVFGHTLGASGIVNAIVSVEAIESSRIPPNAGFENFDENTGVHPLERAENADVENVLSVSLGFGGNNGALVLSRERPQTKPHDGGRRIFVYGAAAVSNGGIYPDGELLAGESPLKIRKFAHLQKMGLQAAKNALAQAVPSADKNRTAVCWGTGLGMTSQTRAFVENVLEKREAEPMPTAFTNSVHNAVPSAIAVREKFGGLNGALTAKEISFECALAQALREIKSGGADAAVVCAGDEYCSLAADFLKSSKYSENDGSKLSDFAAAYYVGADGSAQGAPLFEILECDIRRLPTSDEAEREAIEKILARRNLGLRDVQRWLSPEPCNAYLRRRLIGFAEKSGIGGFDSPFEKYGSNYCVSAAAFAECLGGGAQICALYTLSSTSMRALTLFKKL